MSATTDELVNRILTVFRSRDESGIHPVMHWLIDEGFTMADFVLAMRHALSQLDDETAQWWDDKALANPAVVGVLITVEPPLRHRTARWN